MRAALRDGLWAIALALTISTPPSAAASQAPEQSASRPRPRYLAALRTELEALALSATCEMVSESRAHCSFRHVDAEARREVLVHLVYSDSTDTVYLYVPRLATAVAGDPGTAAILRRLAELNWSLLGAKLEWNPSDGEVRLSAVMHTDSNFDRRAFRSLVRMLTSLADRYGPELERLLDDAHASAAAEN